MITRDFATWRSQTCGIIRARYGVETEGVGLDPHLKTAHEAKKSPRVAAGWIGKKFKLAEQESWKNRNSPSEDA